MQNGMAGALLMFIVLAKCAVFSLLTIGFKPVHGYNLLLVPSDISSHMMTFLRVENLLAERGYNVTVVLPDTYQVQDHQREQVNIAFYKTDYIPFLKTDKWKKMASDSAFDGTIWGKMKFVMAEGEQNAAFIRCMLTDKEFLNILQRRHFDFALVDLMSLTFFLPYKLSIPYAPLTMDCYIKNWPHQPSYIPAVLTDYSDTMTFRERLVNYILILMEERSFLEEDYTISDKYIPEKPRMTLSDLTVDASACFMLRDHVTDFPRPLPPNAVYVGPIGLGVPQPLGKEIKAFIDGAADGVIIVSFGSWSVYMPEYINDILIDSFRLLKQRVIMRYDSDTHRKVPENVMVLPWIPQTDLLANNKTMLFIYHGGANSLNEAAYHAVPSIAIPLILDQAHNSAIAKSKGYGVTLPLSQLSVNNLVGLINDILNDNTIAMRAQEVSAILKNKPVSGISTLDNWLKYLITYGDKYMKSEGLAKLSYVAYKGIDVYAIFILGIMMLCLIMFSMGLCCCFLWKKTSKKLKEE